MLVVINQPSPMDCTTVTPTVPATEVITVRPSRYSKKQRIVDMFPFKIVNELTKAVQDRGVISVDTRTGQLVIERRLQSIPFDVERDKSEKPVPVAETAKEKKP